MAPSKTLSSDPGYRFEKPPELSTFACACNCSWVVAAGWLKPRYRGCEITWDRVSFLTQAHDAHLAIKNPNPFNHPNPALKLQPLGSWMKMVGTRH